MSMAETTSTSLLTSAVWREEVRRLLTLAWPLIAANIATIGLQTTDVVMTSRLGPSELAAATLAVTLIYPFLMFSTGVMTAVAPMVAQALGAREFRSVRRSTRQGLWVGVIICALVVPILLKAEPIFLALGQEPEVARLVGVYMSTASWFYVPATLVVAFRSLLSAHGLTRIIFWVTLAGIVINAIGNYALMYGNFGFPRLELLGSGITTSLTHLMMLLLILTYTLRHRRMRRYHIFVRFWRPDWARFRAIVTLGTPIGLMMAAETSLFGMAAVFIGWIGTAELAGHAVAIQVVSLIFMIPLGISHAATIRVGLAHGRGDPISVTVAGWTAIACCFVVMLAAGLLYWIAPEPLVYLFFDPANPDNNAPISFAISFLLVGALFQIVDGGQVAAAGVLRGLSDTRTPAIIAIIGFWGIGIPSSYLLGFPLGLNGVGVWLGLAIGLAFVSIVLTARFYLRRPA